jgi:hypothetical protein
VPIKGRTRALLERVGRAGTRTRQALSWGRSLPSPAWTLVTPYCKRTRPGRGTNTKAAGFPPLSRPSPATSLPPFALAHALDPSGLGHAAHSLVGLGTPPVSKRRQHLIHMAVYETQYLKYQIYSNSIHDVQDDDPLHIWFLIHGWYICRL